MELSWPTGWELASVLGPAIATLIFWLATRYAVQHGRPLLRDGLLGVFALAVAAGVALGAL